MDTQEKGINLLTSILLLDLCADPAPLPTFAPGAVIHLTEPLRIHEQRDRIIDGQNALIIYNGPANAAGIIEVASCLNCTVQNFRIVDNSGAKSAVLLTNLPDRVGSTGCTIENVMIRYANGEPGPRVAFSIDSLALGGADRNNDLHTIRNCGSNNHAEAAIYLRGTQAHNIVIDRFNGVDYGGRRGYGIVSEDSGFFTVRDSSFGSNQCDIVSTGRECRIVVDGFNSEHSHRYIQNSRTGAESFQSHSNVRWDGHPQPGVPVADLWGEGPYRFANGYFAGVNGVQPTMRFGHYVQLVGERLVTMPGSVSFDGWQLVTHAETPPTGIDVRIPASWQLHSHGATQRTVKSFPWVRKPLKIERYK